MPAKRIVSLIASATEICCGLGLQERLVGRSHECDYPEAIKRLPALTAPKFSPDGSAYEIDQQVKALLQEGLSVYRVDADALKALQPDLIVTQTQCEVCAVSEKEVLQATCTWLESRPQIVPLCTNTLADLWTDIRRVASAAGVEERGEILLSSLESRMAAISQRAADTHRRPTVAAIEWIDPLMVAGNWMPELITLAGGVNLFGQAGRHAPFLSWEQLRDADPDVILVIPCGHDIDRSRRDMPALVRQPGWQELHAVRRHSVFLADGNQFFNRPGPRLVESLEILAEILHPELFHFGHEGAAWQRYSH